MALELPRPLQPWAELLRLFPHDVALALGTLIRRLAVSIGPMQLDPLLGTDEPDGYAGLQNRGDYQRLLLSEWLLAEVEPDEFMRRAVMGEQLFYQPLRLDNKASRASVALFDSGPEQLGTPRIAQLALLILLARRAQAAAAEFYWGILQRPEEELFAAINTERIKHFLHSRTTSLVTSGHLELWRTHLQQLSGIAELWLLSPSVAEKLSAVDRRIVIEDVLSPDQRLLNINLWQNHRWQQMQLQLPEEKLSARLLRNALQSQTAAPQSSTKSIASSAGLLFSTDGRKLAVQLEEGGVVVYSVPNSAQGKSGYPRYFKLEKDEFLFALQIVKKRLQVLSSDGHNIFCHRFPGVERGILPFHEGILINRELRQSRLHHCFFSDQPGFPHSLLFVDDGGVLWQIPWPLASADSVQLADLVLEIIYLNGNIHCIAQRDGQCFLVLRVNSSQPEWQALEIEAQATMNFYFGRTNVWRSKGIGLLAYNNGLRQWMLLYNDSVSSIEVPEKEEVVGTLLLHDGFFTEQQNSYPYIMLPCLVLFDRQAGKLRICQQNYSYDVPGLSNIVEVLVDPHYQQIAVIDKNREVTVFNTERKEIVLHITPGATP